MAAADERVTRARLFERVPDLYDDVRPGYPPELYDEIDRVAGPLAGRRVLDLAAGTGLATRALSARGARVVACDVGRSMLARLRARSPDLPAVVGVAEALPFRAAAFDLVTCATAWHWIEPGAAVAEIRRIAPGGHLALWWANNRHGDGIDWEEAQSRVYERWTVRRGSRPAGHEGVGPVEAAGDLQARGLHVVVETELGWTRTVDRETHLRMLATHSDVLALGADGAVFLAEVAAALAPWPEVTQRLWGPLVIARVP